MTSVSTMDQIYDLGARGSKTMMRALTAPVRHTFFQRVWPSLRLVPGYLIMTPYTLTILLFVGISLVLGLEDF